MLRMKLQISTTFLSEYMQQKQPLIHMFFSDIVPTDRFEPLHPRFRELSIATELFPRGHFRIKQVTLYQRE